MSYKTLEKHQSPDGVLTFSVLQYEDGDISLGFEDFEWHTHADILASLSGASREDAVRRFVDDLLNDKSIIVVVRRRNKIAQVWVTDAPQDAMKYRQHDEVLEFRCWSGRKLVFGG